MQISGKLPVFTEIWTVLWTV